MRIREFFMVQSSDSDFLWKYQILLGVLLVLTAIAILLFPDILVVLAAASMLIVGAGLIGSAWEMRRLDKRPGEPSIIETFEW